MIGYVTFGTDDIARAASFYDELLAVLGAKRFMSSDRFIAWATSPGQPAVAVARPFDAAPATAGNGTMIALAAGNPELVDAVHRRALELGGTDEGAPGPRALPGFYAAYFRDLDGNKLNVFCMTAPAD